MEKNHKNLHEKAVRVAADFHRAEIDLIDVLNEVDVERTWAYYEYSSLYQYARQEMKLSEPNALNYIGVARKSRAVPALRTAIANGEITVSTARKISPVLTEANSAQWLAIAATSTKNELEKEVARANPKLATPEIAKYVSDDRLDLRMGVSEQLMTKFRRAQDLVSNSTRRAATLEDTLEVALDLLIAKKDPVEKAKRFMEREAKKKGVVGEAKKAA